MKPGDRVRVSIATPASWAQGAAESLNGKTGTVARVKTEHNAGVVQVPCAPRYLVRFDTPALPWSTWQSPPAAFWFDANELEKEV